MPYHIEAGSLLLLAWSVCWYFFFIAYGSSSHKTMPAGKSSTGFRRSAYITLALIALWSLCMWSGVGVWPSASPSAWPTLAAVVVGASCVLAGQVLTVLSRRSLQMLTNAEIFFTLNTVKVTSSVYRYSKHPMYVGLWLALLGSSLVLCNGAAVGIVLALITPALVVRASLEG